MLVLSRRTDEEVVIDEHIRIRILTTRGGKVRLGITAPKDVAIERGELAGARTIECLNPPRRDGLLFEAPARHRRYAELADDACEFPSVPV